MITGGCLCGRVRYHTDAQPLGGVLCHCRDCQRVTGSAFGAAMMFPKSAVTVTGETRAFASRGESGKHAVRNFCANCGSIVFGTPEIIPDMINIYAGTLDDPSLFQPGFAIFKRTRRGWDSVDMPGFDGAPEGPPPRVG
jgi:hypothetical protein